jgi:hypothetical protein
MMDLGFMVAIQFTVLSMGLLLFTKVGLCLRNCFSNLTHLYRTAASHPFRPHSVP